MVRQTVIVGEDVKRIFIVLLPFDVFSRLLHDVIGRDLQSFFFDSSHDLAIGLSIGSMEMRILVPASLFGMLVTVVVTKLSMIPGRRIVGSSPSLVDLTVVVNG